MLAAQAAWSPPKLRSTSAWRPARQRRIVTSRTVHDLVVGSDIAMDDLGTRPLKGVDGSWQLFAARP
jgi:class 3 adenylate cyclase